MKYIINRSKWKNARWGKGATRMLNAEGYMCCLGQICKQMGMPDVQLLDKGTPHSAGCTDRLLMNNRGVNNHLSCDAMATNDHLAFSDEQREAELVKMFGDVGVEIVFEGEYAAPVKD